MTGSFMDADFLLKTETARALYHGSAESLPIIDYHCHLDPKEIYDDRVFSSLAEIWLGGDHYKWRVMRASGVPERLILGNETPAYDKFEAWAKTLPLLIGNPLYHWTHLELKRYFGINEPLSGKNCRQIWEEAGRLLPRLSAREILRRSKVEALITTDDPLDNLKWHCLLKEDKSLTCKVLPGFRPDKALGIDKPGFSAYRDALAKACGFKIDSFERLKDALKARLEVFISLGCRSADHGLSDIVFREGTNPETSFQKAVRGETLSRIETEGYQTELLLFLAEMYQKSGIVMQLHFGVIRNCNPPALRKLGPDTGFDATGGMGGVGTRLAGLLGAMEKRSGLPKTILFSLNPGDNAQLASVAGCFQDGQTKGKVQHGSAWWFNDSKTGMEEQMRNLANHSVFGTFIGMLTDSRSLLSYTRHEYFRRILCNLMGDWVEEGGYPNEPDTLGKMVQDISYFNLKEYFNLSNV